MTSIKLIIEELINKVKVFFILYEKHICFFGLVILKFSGSELEQVNQITDYLNQHPDLKISEIFYNIKTQTFYIIEKRPNGFTMDERRIFLDVSIHPGNYQVYRSSVPQKS